MQPKIFTDADGTKYLVTFEYDDEAGVWTATSDDIIGLVLESESLDTLIKRVAQAAPELIELNGLTKCKSDDFSAASRIA